MILLNRFHELAPYLDHGSSLFKWKLRLLFRWKSGQQAAFPYSRRSTEPVPERRSQKSKAKRRKFFRTNPQCRLQNVSEGVHLSIALFSFFIPDLAVWPFWVRILEITKDS
jgi:hypothetical protein